LPNPCAKGHFEYQQLFFKFPLKSTLIQVPGPEVRGLKCR
jgi:hypothetical protein